MRIALIAPPFIEVPPIRYGGTELFIGNLANELQALGHDVTVYTNGDSKVRCRVKWIYPHAEWPLDDPMRPGLKNVDHTAWAMADAAEWADVIHLNDIVGVPFTRFVSTPTVLTIHHPDEPALSEQYARYPDVHYVAIAQWLAERQPMPWVHMVHHGIDPDRYVYSADKDDYVAFLGRMAPAKGPHLAIAAAKKAGVRLKLAGEIQPVFHDYWVEQVLPLIDGDQIQFVGEVDRLKKNALLSRAKALLFPIQWEEPFGLVMIESMACGTPVLALPGGSVDEVVRDGVSGWICRNVDDMAARINSPAIPSGICHEYMLEHFSLTRMAEKYVSVYESVVNGSAETLASAQEA
jgi:glycosyltransferase involved in cell wall biosynthesis